MLPRVRLFAAAAATAAPASRRARSRSLQCLRLRTPNPRSAGDRRLRRQHHTLPGACSTDCIRAVGRANKKNGCHPQSIVTLSKMFKELRAGKEDAEVHRSKNDPTPQRLPASSLQGWMCIASSSDIDTMLTDLYTQMRSYEVSCDC